MFLETEDIQILDLRNSRIKTAKNNIYELHGNYENDPVRGKSFF